MGWFIVGIVCLIAAGILYVVSQSNKRESRALAVTDLTTVADLRALYGKVVGEIGTGSFAQRIALQGTVECEAPLQADLSSTTCAAFRQRVERRYEEDYEEQDSEGHWVHRTREGSETVASNDRQASFSIRDATGSMLILPEGANLEMETTVDRFEPDNGGGSGGLLRLGPLQLNLATAGSGQRTLGYHVHEEILPLGRTVYVIGTASDANGALAISKPTQRHEPFRISLHTRDQVLQSVRDTARYTLYGALAAGALGLLLLLVGVLSRR